MLTNEKLSFKKYKWKHFYAKFTNIWYWKNEVSYLLDIDMCSKLRKIVLKKNNISDSDNLTFLSSIKN